MGERGGVGFVGWGCGGMYNCTMKSIDMISVLCNMCSSTMTSCMMRLQAGWYGKQKVRGAGGKVGGRGGGVKKARALFTHEWSTCVGGNKGRKKRTGYLALSRALAGCSLNSSCLSIFSSKRVGL